MMYDVCIIIISSSRCDPIRRQERKSDDYFLTSSNSIKFFFESGAIKDGELLVSKSESLNKCGHALHDLDPVFAKFSRSQVNVCQE